MPINKYLFLEKNHCLLHKPSAYKLPEYWLKLQQIGVENKNNCLKYIAKVFNRNISIQYGKTYLKNTIENT